MRRVRVQWENPVGLDVVLKLSGDNDYGPYQIYSHHVVFGPSALVYIGMAAEQTFGGPLQATRSLLAVGGERCGNPCRSAVAGRLRER
jgi:hypothetical protein